MYLFFYQNRWLNKEILKLNEFSSLNGRTDGELQLPLSLKKITH